MIENFEEDMNVNSVSIVSLRGYVGEIMVNCSNCGVDAGDSDVCPKCGAKIGTETQNNSCPNCGNEIVLNSKLCPYCGWSKSKKTFDATLDKAINVDDKVSSKFSNILGKSKSVDFVLDKTASLSYKYASDGELDFVNRAYFEKIEPIFVEFLDSIEDNFIKDILIYKRTMMASSGHVVGLVAAQVYTPTKGMDREGAIKFYQDLFDEIVSEINLEKQKGTFNEEEFYKKAIKDSTLNNMSLSGIPKSFKSWNKNKK